MSGSRAGKASDRCPFKAVTLVNYVPGSAALVSEAYRSMHGLLRSNPVRTAVRNRTPCLAVQFAVRGLASSGSAYMGHEAGRAIRDTCRRRVRGAKWRLVLIVRDCDKQTTVVTCTPFLDAVHGAYFDLLVEAARGENVVQLVLRGRWRLRGGVASGHIPGV